MGNIKKTRLSMAILAALSSTALVGTNAVAAEKVEDQVEVIQVTSVRYNLAI